MDDRNALLRQLPSVDQVLSREAIRALGADHPRPAVVRAVREAVAEARRRVLAGGSPEVLDGDVVRALAREVRPGLRRVVNATGVVLHTNLGRAPMARAAVEAAAAVTAGYANLELDLASGERGRRYDPVEPLLAELCGAPAAVVVNNNAAAVWLTLAALAAGKECVVSRGELVEIGGGFRIPDVMRMSGAHLVEVGTSNKTRLTDYEAALSPETGLLVKVHKSNFALVGFTEEVTAGELSALGRARGVPVYEDLGSGCLVDLAGLGLPHEPTVAEALAAGADVVTFSGDKLLGGPQAGVIVGRKDLLAKIERHPLNRVLRIDKATVAALEATLRLYRDGRWREVPALRLLGTPVAELEDRARVLRDALAARGVEGEIVATASRVGGGALPTANPESRAVALGGDVEALHRALRRGEPAVVARIAEGRLLLDVRTVEPGDLASLADAVAAAWRTCDAP